MIFHLILFTFSRRKEKFPSGSEFLHNGSKTVHAIAKFSCLFDFDYSKSKDVSHSIKIIHWNSLSPPKRSKTEIRYFPAKWNFSMTITVELTATTCTRHNHTPKKYIVACGREKSFAWLSRARAQCTCVSFSVFHTSDGTNLFSTTIRLDIVGSTDVASARLTICAFVRLSRSLPIVLGICTLSLLPLLLYCVSCISR